MSMVNVETATLLVANQTMTAGNGGTSIIITPPTLTRRLTLIIDATNLSSSNAEIDVIGNTTNVVYAAGILRPGQFQTTPLFVAIEPGVDATYTILNSKVAGGTYQLWVLASTTSPLIAGTPFSPITVIGPQSIGSNTPPINVSGSPIGTFSIGADVAVSAATANQQLIAAQGAGNSIYIQQLTCYVVGGNGPVGFAFHPSGGTIFGRSLVGSSGSEQLKFPGGFKLNNVALQVDTSLATTGTLFAVSITYSAGTTL